MSSAWLEAGGGWLPGMLVVDPRAGRASERLTEDHDLDFVRSKYTELGWVPDPTDGATLGAMLQEVRRVYSDPGAWITPWGDGWAVFARIDEGRGRDGVSQGTTEAEALAGAYRSRPTNEEG